MRPVPIVGMLLVAGLLAGCASDVPESEPTRPADALTWSTEVDEEIDGLPIAVGSPSRPVDLLLGGIATESRVGAGADVTDDRNLGDPQTPRDTYTLHTTTPSTDSRATCL